MFWKQKGTVESCSFSFKARNALLDDLSIILLEGRLLKILQRLHMCEESEC